MEGHTAYMQPCLLPKIIMYIYFYVKKVSLHYWIIVQSSGSQPWQDKVYRKLCTYRHQNVLSTRSNSFKMCIYSKYSILTYCCGSSITSLKELCTAVSLKTTFDSRQIYTCCTPLCQGTAQKDATSCKERCDVWLGMSYVRNTCCCIMHVLGDLKTTTVRSHAETCSPPAR